MDNIPPTTMERAQLLGRLQELEIEHSDLDAVIARLVGDPRQDDLMLRRLKKRKLLLKDQIAYLHAQLVPDIVA